MSLFTWIDKSPVNYWLSGFFPVLCLGLMAFLPLLPRGAPWRRAGSRPKVAEEFFFCVLIFLALFAFRWVYIFFPFYLNPDEAALVMGGLNLQHDPIFWRSVSLGTSGPLNAYALYLPSLSGFDINYAFARTIGLLLEGGSVVFSYLAARLVLRPAVARVVTLAPVLFLSLTNDTDFIHYSSEHTPAFLLSAACFCAVFLICQAQPTNRAAYLTGLLVGSVPFAKLQGVPPAGLIAVLSYVYILTRPVPWKRRLILSGYMTVGGATCALFFAALTMVGGAFGHALHSYLGMNVSYTQHGGVPLSQMIGLAPEFLGRSFTFKPYVVALTLLGLIASIIGIFEREKAGPLRWIWILAVVYLIGAWLAVLMPGRLYRHYLFFLVIPTAFWLQASLALAGVGRDQPGAARRRIFSFGLLAPTAIVVLSWPLLAGFHQWKRPLGAFGEFRAAPPRPIVSAVKRHAFPGQMIGLWGWMYEILAEGGFPRATRDDVLQHAWIDSSLPGRPTIIPEYKDFVPRYYFDLYLADLKRNRPVVFVDACAPGAVAFTDRRLFGYETFPELAAYVDANYELVEEVNQARVFRRKD